MKTIIIKVDDYVANALTKYISIVKKLTLVHEHNAKDGDFFTWSSITFDDGKDRMSYENNNNRHSG